MLPLPVSNGSVENRSANPSSPLARKKSELTTQYLSHPQKYPSEYVTEDRGQMFAAYSREGSMYTEDEHYLFPFGIHGIEGHGEVEKTDIASSTACSTLGLSTEGKWEASNDTDTADMDESRSLAQCASLEHLTAPPAGDTAIPPLRLVPICPSELRRYDNQGRDAKKGQWKPWWEIAGMQIASDFTDRNKRQEWVSFAHPEGKLYHRTLQRGIAFTTDTDIDDDCMFGMIENTLADIIDMLERVRVKRSNLPHRYFTEIVLDIVTSTDGKLPHCEHYVVDHENQHILWLENNKIWPVRRVFGGSCSIGHIRQMLRHEYFQHVEYYPHGNKLTQKRMNELKGFLAWALIDTITSDESLASFKSEELQSFLSLTETFQAIKDDVPEVAVACEARLRARFEQERFHHYYGTSHARLSLGKAIHENMDKPVSALGRFLSLLLFRLPMKHIEALNKSFADHTTQRVLNTTVSNELIDGWQMEIVNATVLLNANIAYLAIPGIIGGSGNGDTGQVGSSGTTSFSLGEIASLVSMITSLCSAIIGLLLTKRLRALQDKEACDFAYYYHTWWSERYGLLKLAIMYSLPYGMLMWGAISFVVAISYIVFVQFHLDAQSILLTCVLGVVLSACLWAAFQINTWNTFFRSLMFWTWTYPTENTSRSQTRVSRAIRWTRNEWGLRLAAVLEPVRVRGAALPTAMHKLIGTLRRWRREGSPSRRQPEDTV